MTEAQKNRMAILQLAETFSRELRVKMELFFARMDRGDLPESEWPMNVKPDPGDEWSKA